MLPWSMNDVRSPPHSAEYSACGLACRILVMTSV